MKYTSLEIDNNKEYKLKLNIENLLKLEKKLGKNPVNIFGSGEIPSLEDVMTVLHFALLKYEPKTKAYDVYDEYIEAGHSFTDMALIVVELFQNDGLIPKTENKDIESKNV